MWGCDKLAEMPNSTAKLAEPVIRPYRSADYACVLRGVHDLQDYERALHPSRRPAAEVAEAYLAQLLRRVAERSGAIFVAESAGTVVGFVACYIKDTESLIETAAFRRYGYVSDLDIATEWRGRGLAQCLLAAAEQHLAQRRVTQLRIGVLAANIAAQRAYAKYGFAPYESELEKMIVVPGT
jgi:ribosomal protein S18 acetylase RimI-like enzyme